MYGRHLFYDERNVSVLLIGVCRSPLSPGSLHNALELKATEMLTEAVCLNT